MIIRQCYEPMTRPQFDAFLVEWLDLVTRGYSRIAMDSPIIGSDDNTPGPNTHVGGH